MVRLLRWGKLCRTDTIVRLQDDACYELHFILQLRDPEPFKSTVLRCRCCRCTRIIWRCHVLECASACSH
jgi:hypothetical protein